MIRLVYLLLIVLLAGAVVLGAFWLHNMPWSVAVIREGQPDREFSMAGVGIFLLALGALVALLWGMVTSLFLMPGRIKSMRERGRVRKGNQALADGLLAAEGGDLKNARKMTQKALTDAEDERLALLLDARTAEQKEDWTRAERAYAELARKPGAHLAGLKGLTGAAIKRGDYTMAIERAREALDMKGETGDWPFTSLFEVYVARGDWAEARRVLSVGESKSHIEPAIAKRRRAVLLVANAHDIISGDPEGAEKLLAEALKYAPGFPPAAFHLARLQLAREAIKPAISTLETGWKARPHPALALIAERIDEQNENGPRKAMTALSNVNKTHRETAILRADLAIAGGDWAGAEKALGPLLQGTQPTSRVSRLMEMIAHARGDASAERDWSAKSASAPREAEWSDIEPDGSAFNYDHENWARLVYTFGDSEQLIHPRHEGYSAELDVVRNRALPAPTTAPVTVSAETPSEAAPQPDTPKAPPTDYAD